MSAYTPGVSCRLLLLGRRVEPVVTRVCSPAAVIWGQLRRSRECSCRQPWPTAPSPPSPKAAQADRLSVRSCGHPRPTASSTESSLPHPPPGKPVSSRNLAYPTGRFPVTCHAGAGPQAEGVEGGAGLKAGQASGCDSWQVVQIEGAETAGGLAYCQQASVGQTQAVGEV